MKKYLRFGCALIAILLVAVIIYCAVNPVTGKREFMLLTESDEAALGVETDKEVVAQYGLYEDPQLLAYIEQIGLPMTKVTHRPNLNYTFKIVDTPVINAFAVPGGYVYFTRGILGYFNNEAELAGVLGHELGHVSARHTAQQYSRAQLAQLGLGVGMVFSEKFREYAGLAQFGVGLLFLRFSRDHERQADDLGVEYSMKAGYDPEYMAEFFTTLERLHPESGQNGLEGWFSTHPNPADRVVAVRNKKKEWQAKLPQKPLVVGRNEYLRHIDGITFGDDPRQGYVEANSFYHPQLRFTFPLPSGWQLMNTPTQVQLVSPKEDAAILFSMDKATNPAAAAQSFVQGASASVQSNDAITLNGMHAQRVVSDVQSQEETLHVLSYFIQKDGQVYVFHGLASQALFANYNNDFSNTMSKFKNLSDPAKINVKPDRVTLKTVNATSTVKNALLALGSTEDELEQMAILNGMQLGDQVEKGALLKMITR
jgi:predicted Zn-dependent protease